MTEPCDEQPLAVILVFPRSLRVLSPLEAAMEGHIEGDYESPLLVRLKAHICKQGPVCATQIVPKALGMVLDAEARAAAMRVGKGFWEDDNKPRECLGLPRLSGKQLLSTLREAYVAVQEGGDKMPADTLALLEVQLAGV